MWKLTKEVIKKIPFFDTYRFRYIYIYISLMTKKTYFPSETNHEQMQMSWHNAQDSTHNRHQNVCLTVSG